MTWHCSSLTSFSFPPIPIPLSPCLHRVPIKGRLADATALWMASVLFGAAFQGDCKKDYN
jgi:hypothetical protein